MIKHSLALCLFVACLLMVSPAQASHSFASCDEAKALAVRAAAFLEEHGPEEASRAFLDHGGPYKNRDLYIFVLDKSGKVLLHAGWPNMKGASLSRLKDITGYKFGKDMLRIKEEGWVHYKYGDPSDSDRIKDKRTFLLRVDPYLLGVGCYENERQQS